MAITDITEFLKRQSALNIKRRILPSPTVDVANGGGGYELFATAQSGEAGTISECPFTVKPKDESTVTVKGSMDNLILLGLYSIISDQDEDVTITGNDGKVFLNVYWDTDIDEWNFQYVFKEGSYSDSDVSDCSFYYEIAEVVYGSDSSYTVNQLWCTFIYVSDAFEIKPIVTNVFYDATCNAIRQSKSVGFVFRNCNDDSSSSSCSGIVIPTGPCPTP